MLLKASKSIFRKYCVVTISLAMIASAALFSNPSLPVSAETNVIAFPGAEGGGKFATGGRGGEVVYVTNLNDSGPGSFRDAVSRSNRIVLFKVGGTIELNSNVVISSNVTVAGQTAPGGAGITLKNYKVGLGGSNVILRFISSRPGERGTSADYDAFGGANGSNSIVDHVSIGWANDEQWGLYSKNDNYTVQYSIIGPSNSFSYHSKGIHGFGIMLGRSNASWHHNLIVHNVSRNFRGKIVGTNTSDFTNNVIYNWGTETTYGTIGHVNYVNNTLKMGNSTISGKHYANVGDSGTYPENFSIYLTGNRFLNQDNTNYSTFTTNNWSGITYNASSGKTEANTRSNVPFPMIVNGVDVSTVANVESAQDAYDHVLDYAGAGISPSQRPAIDRQVAHETSTGTGTLSGARPYSEATAEQRATIDSFQMATGVHYQYPSPVLTGAPTDTDGDGMPDEWESARGLNPYSKTAADGTLESSGNYIGQGYTNIEYYINDLTVNAFPPNVVQLSPTITSGTDAYSTIEAEDYSSMSGVQSEASSEGGENIGYIHNGDYIAFDDVDFGNNPPAKFEARLATGNSSGSIEIRLGSPTGTLVGTCPVSSTGGWQTWATQSCSLSSGPTGTHDVYLVFTGGSGYLFNINWFKFIP
ncbi:carbohydrate-binding protein [Marinicrinis lubricantis]|uniref:Carbohydrate-binding protein n=1 Tax=Marinicrinis lubricantis TaxID=2086470 RepID=A0ABW1IJZ3_9BACL